MTDRAKPCTFFAQGRCRKGDSCTYIHDVDSSQGLTTNHGHPTGGRNTETEFRKWRYLIPLQPTDARLLGRYRIADFWQQARRLVSSNDVSQVQETITLIETAGGMTRVAEVLDVRHNTLTEAQLRDVFNHSIQPFFQTVTHRNVLGSPVLHNKLITIFNYVFGFGGRTGHSLFEAVTRHLISLKSTEGWEYDDTATDSTLSALESSLAVFRKMFELNSTAQVTEDLKPIVQKFEEIIDDTSTKTNEFRLQPSIRDLARVKQRLLMGTSIPGLSETHNDINEYATFQIARDGPGALSDEGPRHDNDDESIVKIKALPTPQEIQSSRTEYLPLVDQHDWHVSGLAGLLDRHYRLLREDTVGQLRDVARFELERLRVGYQQPVGRENQTIRSYEYRQVTIEHVEVDAYDGISVVLGFESPKHTQTMNERQRRDWWESSRRLGRDALVCLLSTHGTVTFLVVASPSNRKPDPLLQESRAPLQQQYSLTADPERAYVITRLANPEDAPRLVEGVADSWEAQFSLVEFPGVLLPAFLPVLHALQQMSVGLDVPFAGLLAPEMDSGLPSTIVAPLYATRPGFYFDLSVITANGDPLQLHPGKEFDVRQLQSKTSLDHAQAEAVSACLNRSLALVQGPPGTGKSYTGVSLIRVLLHNKEKASLGPILCVCHTNHALDQLLEHLLDSGVTQIVRVGSGSKSHRLTEVNLRELSRTVERTKTEGKEHYKAILLAKSEAQEVNRLVKDLWHLGSLDQIRGYLRSRFPSHCDQLFSGEDDEGFSQVWRDENRAFANWFYGGRDHAGEPNGRIRPIDVLEETPLFSTTNRERRRLHNSWVEGIKAEIVDELNRSIELYQSAKDRIALIRAELELRVLRSANVIGITTSGLARKLPHFRQVESKVLICEEAGEVLESHLLTALLPKVEHAILIGDHLQLRPHVQNYDLSTESQRGRQYSLDVSLFERLVNPASRYASPLPYCTLKVQRRMHPLVSELIRSTLYKDLEDHESVSCYPAVSGMRKRLFWMDHDKAEEGTQTGQSTSHTNLSEVDIVASLVSHLVRQGTYQSNDIAVLTPYLGQLRSLKQKLSKTFEIVLGDGDVMDLEREGDNAQDQPSADIAQGKPTAVRSTLLQALRIATVDNFQGEEAKVIVVSLVRSNEQNRCGFLRTPNRINVLLSRAQHGMYIIGNSRTAGSVEMWSQVIEILKGKGNFGTALELCCSRHPDKILEAANSEDFLRVAPEGGCPEPCNKQLLCGHACEQKCHSDILHDKVFCQKSCSRPKAGCNHNCPRLCGEKCPARCEIPVPGQDLHLECGHISDTVPCYEHQDPSLIRCHQIVSKAVPGCNHIVEEPCFVDVNQEGYQCRAQCGINLACGHCCGRPCKDCNVRSDGEAMKTDHGPCRQACGRDYNTCRHHCKAPCHGSEECPLCRERCEVQCSHARCSKKCHEPCVPCAEEHCQSACPHSQCTMPCSAPCNRIVCGQRCTKLLECGHQCPSVCGEPCPRAKFCQICGEEDVRQQQADIVMFDCYGDIDLDEDPCLFLSCGHVLTMSSLDGMMNMSEHYELESSGTARAVKRESEPFSSLSSDDSLPSCPHCRGPMRNIARYGRIVRRALLDESAKKLTAWSNVEHHKLAERLQKAQESLIDSLESAPKPPQKVKLDNGIEEQLKSISHLKTRVRYRKALAVRNAIRNFVQKLSREEQPYQRVRDYVETARRQRGPSQVAEVDMRPTELNLREHLVGSTLLLRCDIVILSDVVSLYHKSPLAEEEDRLELDLSSNRNQCDALITDAAKAHSFRQMVEAHVHWARCAAMECSAYDNPHAGLPQPEVIRDGSLRRQSLDHLQEALSICEAHAGPTQGLGQEIADVKRMIESSTYESEMRMIYTTMQRDFGGTGHWYRCSNGHPFTIGECGMPMQLAMCPVCGEGIGGSNHEPTEGVTHAPDIEARFGGPTR